jgi:hypothetical protein
LFTAKICNLPRYGRGNQRRRIMVDRAIFGWPTVLASEGETAWKKLIPQALIAQERVITYGQDGEQLLAQLDEAGL